MTQHTRKDPRARVLSMTVRYKSATLDEFIEHHSHDVSRGGMFIKTPQPFPPGTLLKFEVRIAADRTVMQGVGRVVWKRDPSNSDAERPAGMGVKFIKLDDKSREVIDQLVEARHADTSAFDDGAGPELPDTRSSIPSSRNASSKHRSSPEKTSPAEPSFFPKSDGELREPDPEDCTVMKQATELLQEALREVATPDADASHSSSSLQAADDGEEMEVTKPGRPSGKYNDVAPSAKEEARPASKKPGSQAPAAERQHASSSSKPGTKVQSEKSESDRTAASSSAQHAANQRRAVSAQPSSPSGGGARGIVTLVFIAAAAAAVYWVTRPKPTPLPSPAQTPEPAAVASSRPEQEPSPAESSAPDIDLDEADAPPAEATGPDAALPEAASVPIASTPEPAASPPSPVRPNPPAVVAARPVAKPAPKPKPKPKPVEPKAEVAEEPAPQPTQTAPEPKVEPEPARETKPAVSATAKPEAPKVTAPTVADPSDNPY